MKLIVEIIALSLVLHKSIAEKTCDSYTDEENKCKDVFKDANKWVKSPIDLFNSIPIGAACGNFTLIKYCQRDYAHCEEHKKVHAKQNWEGSKAVLDYVCGYGLEDYKANYECWRSSSVGTVVNRCVLEEQEAPQDTNDKKCKVENRAVECHVTEVKKSCKSKQAVSVMKHFQILRLRPILPNNCKLAKDDGDWDEDGMPGSSTIIQSSIIATLLLVCSTFMLN